MLARDRVGKKPLLWTRLADGTLAFASELKALLRLPGCRASSTSTALDAYLALQYVPGGTAPRGRRRSCRPATCSSPRTATCASSATGELEPASEPRARGRVARARARDGARGGAPAARRRRPARRAALGRDRLEHRRRAMAQASTRAGADVLGRLRRRALRRAAATRARRGALRRPCTRRCCSSRTRPTLLPRLADAYDEPFGDASALPHLPRLRGGARGTSRSRWPATAATRRSAATSATARTRSPAGSRVSAAVARRRARAPRAAAGRSEPRSTAVPRSPLPRRGGRAGRSSATARLMEIFPPSSARELWTPTLVPQPARRLAAARPAAGRRHHRPAAARRRDVPSRRPALKADIASMAYSLELRSPFLDHEVLELGARPARRAEDRGRAARSRSGGRSPPTCPPEIPGRGKRGFGVPLARWFRDELRELAGDLLLGERARAAGSSAAARSSACSRDHVAGPRRPRRPALVPRHARALAAEHVDAGSRRSPRRRPRDRAARSPLVAAAASCRASPCSSTSAATCSPRSRRRATTSRARSSTSGTFGFIPGEPSA